MLVFRDVTEEYEKQRQLEFTTFTLEQAKTAVFWAYSNGKFLYANKTAQDWLQYSLDEILEMSVADINPEFPQEAWPDHWNEIKTHGMVRMESIHQRKNGEIYPVEIYSNYVRFEDEEYKLAFVYDITEKRKIEEMRQRAQQELTSAQNYLANIVNSMPSVLIGVNCQGTVTQWNREAERVTGLLAQDALGQPLEQAYPRLAPDIERVRYAIKTGQEQIESKRSRQKNGETRYEDVTIYPLISNNAKGAVIRIDDVTERMRMEEMMIQSEKMLSVGGLAAGMAHEINNPLAGMMQTANVMNNRLTNPNLPANQRAAKEAGISMEAVHKYMESRGIPRMVAAINEAGRRAAEIVDNMLSFARKNEAVNSTHNIANLLDKTLELASTDYDLKKQYDFKTIHIIREYQADLPLVPCEGAKIQQVLLNILRNGAEAMQEAGTKNPTFVLRTRYEKLRKQIIIQIEDNGPGMDESTRKRVFEPFFTTKPVGVGTGLGLSVSYFIITENHGGDLNVISQPGHGTTFFH